jgi:hypothetical protein
MKISKAAYDSLAMQVQEVHASKPKAWASYKAQGLSAERYRWDILWASGFRVNDLYRNEGLNDAHISTALRKALPLD